MSFLKEEIFYSIKELRILAKRWRVRRNTIRPHPSLGYRPPSPEAWLTEDSFGYEKVERQDASRSPLRRRAYPLPAALH